MAKKLGTVIRRAMQDEIRTGNNDAEAKVTHIQLVRESGPPGEQYGTEEITWSTNIQGQQDGEVTFSYQFGEVSGSTTIELSGFLLGKVDSNGNFAELGEGEFTETVSVTVTSFDTVNITVTGVKIELDEEGS